MYMRTLQPAQTPIYALRPLGSLPPLHKQKVNSQIPQHQEHTTKDRQSNAIIPQLQDFESERAQDGWTRYLDIEAVFVVCQGEVAHFVDDHAFEPEVED